MTTSPSSSSPSVRSTILRLMPYTVLISFGPGLSISSSLAIYNFLMCSRHYRGTPQVPIPGDEICKSKAISALTADLFSVLTILNAVASLGTTAFIQRGADKYGRKIFLIVAPLLSAFATALLIISSLWVRKDIYIYAMLCLAEICSSLGQQVVLIVWTMVADVVTVEERTPIYSRLGGLLGGGTGAALTIAGFLSHFGDMAPLYASVVLQALGAVYAAVFLFETRREFVAEEEPSAVVEQPIEESSSKRQLSKTIVSAVLSPIRPLRLLLPRRSEKGQLDLNLLFLGLSHLVGQISTLFAPTALLVSLPLLFGVTTGQISYFLSTFTFARFLFLVGMFPTIIRVGRTWFHRRQLKQAKMAITMVVEAQEAGTASEPTDRTPLISGVTPTATVIELVEDPASLANHFDVIMALVSWVIEGIAYAGFALARSMLGIYGATFANGFAGGAVACTRSLFLASVKPEEASESLAAHHTLTSLSLLLAPAIFGPIFSALIKAGHAERFYLIMSVGCIAGASFLLGVRKLKKV